MTEEEAKKLGATHYDLNDSDDSCYKLDEDSVYYWWRGTWYFFCYIDRTDDLCMDLKPL